MTFKTCSGELLRSLVDTNHNHVIVIVKCCVEISEENVAKSVLIRLLQNWLQSNLAVVLILVKLVRVALRIDNNVRRLKLELDWLQLVPYVLASLAGNPYLPVTLFRLFLLDRVRVALLQCCIAHCNKNIVPHEFGKHDADACRVNECDFRFLSIGHVEAIIEEIIYAEAPLRPTEVGVVIQTIFATLDLTVEDFSEANLGDLRLRHRILKIKTDNGLLDDTLHVKQLHIVDLSTGAAC